MKIVQLLPHEVLTGWGSSESIWQRRLSRNKGHVKQLFSKQELSNVAEVTHEFYILVYNPTFLVHRFLSPS
jgi:hypothetical protein